ncbi:unnamed protein product [Blepharisma stoltei]|uniref:Uncharacterized protein n=1 Tax=Blepharisma stoltei TaxID=1481888 RepID=A0AAU9JW33_9CILI|nr:unnamed protein product [Blepharisma stoltei]
MRGCWDFSVNAFIKKKAKKKSLYRTQKEDIIDMKFSKNNRMMKSSLGKLRSNFIFNRIANRGRNLDNIPVIKNLVSLKSQMEMPIEQYQNKKDNKLALFFVYYSISFLKV